MICLDTSTLHLPHHRYNLVKKDTAKPVEGTRWRWIDATAAAVAGGGSGGSGNVALSGGVGGNVLEFMIDDALCAALVAVVVRGFRILGFLGFGIDVQNVPFLGVAGDLAIGGNAF